MAANVGGRHLPQMRPLVAVPPHCQDMPRRVPLITRTLILFGVVVPALAWALVKPVRVAVPTLNGVSCVEQVCVDQLDRLGEAQALYHEGNEFITERFGLELKQPRVVFCSLPACAEGFGLGTRSAVTVGTVGTVIGPKAWKSYYLRHELIHQLQADKLGSVLLLLKPSWLLEGMAYALSDDPRPVLAEPWQGYRAQFGAWFGKVGRDGLWERAKGVWVWGAVGWVAALQPPRGGVSSLTG